MRSPDAKRVCQFSDPTKPNRICGITLKGSSYRWCLDHAREVRKQQRRARGAEDIRRWRSQNKVHEQIRNYIRRSAASFEAISGCSHAAIVRRLQQVFGDPAGGPDIRCFGYYCFKIKGTSHDSNKLHSNSIHAHIVYCKDDLLAVAFYDRPLPVPVGTIELSEDSPIVSKVKAISETWELCDCCGKPFWLKNLRRPICTIFGVPVYSKEPLDIYSNSFPFLDWFAGTILEKRNDLPGLKLWIAIGITKVVPWLNKREKRKGKNKQG
jgi:hypothetical protein